MIGLREIPAPKDHDLVTSCIRDKTGGMEERQSLGNNG